MLHIKVPAGIGDISWSYSKVSDLGEELNVQISADNPQRSLDYVKMLPGVIKVEYIKDNFHKIVDSSIPFTTTKQDFLDVARKTFVNFSPNRFLEAGHRLETWIPELTTTFHYEINTPLGSDLLAQHIKKDSANLIGIYTSSYHTICHWNGWHLTEWSLFIHHLHTELPSAFFVLIGAPYDKPFCDDLSKLINTVPHLNIAGQTSTAQVIEVIRRLKYLVSFPSGLPVLANVLRIPVMMFYPQFLWKIYNTWCDPESLKYLTYKGCIFPKVKEAVDWLFKDYKLKDKI